MNPEQWQQIKTVFHAARALPQRERVVYLREACAGNEALYAEVAAMLELDDDADEFMQQPVLAETRFGSLLKEDQDLPQGQRIGPYEIERKIGEGGMGQVYRARDSRLGRPVAIKVLRTDLTRDAERVRRFQQEARAASALNHPNILTIYEVDRANELDFIATEFIEGQTLRAILKAGGLTIGEVLDVVMQVGKALETAHRAGIIHRDIKPENLMRRTDGYVKVLDFGLAKLTEPQGQASFVGNAFSHFTTRPGVVMGTVTYMSPEQARGLDVDPRTDIFSLGVVLYEMLTGRVPFNGHTTSDVIVALLEREPQPLESHISGLPETFQQIIQRALAKPLERRYATMNEMLADLQKLKQDLELASNMKRVSKTKSAEQSLLNMRVGHSRSHGDLTERATRESPARTTSTWRSTFGAAVLWVKSHRGYALAALLIVLTSWAIYLYWPRESGAEIHAIAVLPFVNDTGDTAIEYLPDGLTESLMQSLQQVPGLRVMARGTVYAYKGRDVDPRQIGQALNVQAVVNGRVKKQGEQLIIQVEVADARDGARLWGNDYQRPMKDLAAVQNELSQAISDQLAQRSGTQKAARPTQPSTQNAEAFRLYLLGRYHANRQTREDGNKARDYYQQAISLDPNYALAYSGLADHYAFVSSRYLAPQEAMPLARQAALRALELNPKLAEAHYSLALVKSWGDWDWAGAEQEFKQALALNPNLADAHTIYANQLSLQQRFVEFHREIQLSQQLDPLSAIALEMSVWGLYFEGRYDQALAECRKLLSLDPSYHRAYMHLGYIYRQKGQLREAIAEVEKVPTQQRPETLSATLAYLYAVAGEPEKARKLLAELEEISRRQHWLSPYLFAKIYLGLGEHERAIACLEQTYAAHSEFLMSIGIDPVFAPLHADPRFNELVRKIGLQH